MYVKKLYVKYVMYVEKLYGMYVKYVKILRQNRDFRL